MIADALVYCAVITVEMFVTTGQGDNDGPLELCVNEIAPRVHNSGHWTLDGAFTSQFEQHLRAIAGWPVGAPDRAEAGGHLEMDNLIGEEVLAWAKILAEPTASLHLYGKVEARPRRKMGHVTRIVQPPDS